jgi:SAM-dependent methyltransferase
MVAWYDQAFGPWYLKLYPHRDLDEARRMVENLSPWIPGGGRILDIGCGPGRHMIALAERGYRVVGLDRSAVLLEEAARSQAGRLIRGDMRQLPFEPGAFRAALSMFTTFGYFGSREAHRDLLSEIARVVETRGRLVLDYLNAPKVRESLVPESSRTVENHCITERRFFHNREDGDQVVKELVIQGPDGQEVARYREEVSLYDRNEVLELLSAGGWAEVESLGDYRGGQWTPGSDRLIVIAEKEED